MTALRGFALALGFLTRLPAPRIQYVERDYGAALSCFPLVGLLIGALLMVVAEVASAALTEALAAVAVVSASAALTGALHLDGLADTVDGASGGRGERTRTLAIMRDSRIGAHGAVALVLLLSAKLAATAELLRGEALLPLLLAPLSARWVVVLLIARLPYARPTGLGKPFHMCARAAHALIASAISLTALAAAGHVGLRCGLAALLVALGLGLWARSRLGGLTGDLYGAAIELAETLALVVSSAHAF